VPFSRRVYVNADEPLEVRRKRTMDRLRNRAQSRGQTVSVSNDGVLSVDGNKYFCLERGFVNRLTLIIMASCNLRFCSYNCRGFNSAKKQYVTSLLNICDFLLVQEHWLCDEEISSLSSLISDFLSCGVSGFSSDQILGGRPYGGCAIFWRRVIGRCSCS